jgi:hypothetical protein
MFFLKDMGSKPIISTNFIKEYLGDNLDLTLE